MRVKHQVTESAISLRLAQGLEGVETANKEMHIDYLADRPEFIPTLARWHHEEWADLRPGDSVVIATLENELLGSASLIEHDMDSRLDLTPWLAGVFVAPQHRRKGIGTALVRRVLEEATPLPLSKLYLYTVDSTAFYTNLGWSLVEKARYRGKNVSIMSFSTRTPAP